MVVLVVVVVVVLVVVIVEHGGVELRHQSYRQGPDRLGDGSGVLPYHLKPSILALHNPHLGRRSYSRYPYPCSPQTLDEYQAKVSGDPSAATGKDGSRML